MWVQMLEGISGGRPGGGVWPPRGYLLECEDWEGEDLIAHQLAVPAGNPFPAASAPKDEWVKTAAEQGVEPDGLTKAELQEEVTTPPVAAPEVPEPAPADVKAAWVAYAVSQGANQAEAESLTKSQLQSAYGGRLLS